MSQRQRRGHAGRGALSRKPGHAGAIAFSWTGDPSSGDFCHAKLIRKFGDIPDDLSAL
ncbi:hypothetical protein ABIA40_004032 [Bradyrhizobium sp. USDA 223]